MQVRGRDGKTEMRERHTQEIETHVREREAREGDERGWDEREKQKIGVRDMKM